MMLHEILRCDDSGALWFVIRPPHTACYVEDRKAIRYPASVLEEPITDRFPPDGLSVQLPVSRYRYATRTIKVTENKVGSLMMEIYLFYWRPIGSLAAMADAADDGSFYCDDVIQAFASGGQPKWGDLIGHDFTHDEDWAENPMLKNADIQVVRNTSGYCEGRVYFEGLREIDGNILRLICGS